MRERERRTKVAPMARASALSTALFLALGFAAGCAASSARTAPTLTKTEARALGEEATARIALDQLYDILEPSPFPTTARPQRRMSDMWFSTKPRASQAVGLCRIDTVRLELEPVGPELGADTEVRVSGVEARSKFHFLTEPTSPEVAWVESDRRRPVSNAQCAATDEFEDQYFSAPDEETAAEGYWLAQTVLREILSGAPSFDFECVNVREGCEALIARAQANGLESLERCTSDRCVIATFYNVRLTIYRADYFQPDRGRLTRAEAAQLIVLSHSRID